MRAVLLIAAYLVLIALLLTISFTNLAWMLYAWRTPETIDLTAFPMGVANPRLSFSLIVPARHEEQVLWATIERLVGLDHPCYEVLVVIGHDDHGTLRVAEAAAEYWPEVVRVVIDHNWPKTKPKALNTALPLVRGAVVGIFDAEDEVDGRLLRRVDQCFQASQADMVQGGVQIMNFGSNWYALHGCLEYYFWFRSRLQFHAARHFIPLGGNTVFVRTKWLRRNGGWDGDCLAEDCELGVRLSVQGARAAVVYNPEMVTREEAPPTLAGFFRQRTRWDQGYLQVLRKGVWRQLPNVGSRLLARYTLLMPFVQALYWVFFPVSLATVVILRLPVALALISWLPSIPFLMVVASELVGLSDVGRLYYVRPRIRDYVVLVLSTFPYQMVLAAAALRAVLRELRGERSWEKTTHVGAHRADASQMPEQVGRIV